MSQCYSVGKLPIYFIVSYTCRRTRCSRGLRRGSTAARLLRLWFRIPPGVWMSVCCKCCVLSGRGICDELITRPEESYRLWCVVVCDLETSWMRRPWPALGRSATGGENLRRFGCFFDLKNCTHSTHVKCSQRDVLESSKSLEQNVTNRNMSRFRSQKEIKLFIERAGLICYKKHKINPSVTPCSK